MADQGTAIDRRIVKGQIDGVSIQGLGYSLLESNELLKAVLLPPTEFNAHYHRKVSPISDHRSTAQYRRTIAANLLADCIETLGKNGPC